MLFSSSTSGDISIKGKLEQTKRYLRLLKENKPELFEGLYLNGDLTKEAIKLRKSYNKILKLSGFPGIDKYFVKTKFKKFEDCIKEDFNGLTQKEIDFINNTNLSNGDIKKRKTFNCVLPPELEITPNDLPTYVRYVPERKKAGEHFVISRHPKVKELYNRNYWATTSARDVSITDKYKQLLDFLAELDKPKPKKKKHIVV